MQQSLGLSGRSKLSFMHLISSLHAPSSSSSFLALKPAISFPQITYRLSECGLKEASKNSQLWSFPRRLSHHQWKYLTQQQYQGEPGFPVTDRTLWVNLHLHNCSSFSQEPWEQLSLWYGLRFTPLARISSQMSGYTTEPLWLFQTGYELTTVLLFWGFL